MSKKKPLIPPESIPLNLKIRPLTKGQSVYCKSIDSSIITLCLGPAGSGKTFLAVYKAIKFLQDGLVKKIMITRPVREAGESLGFLPGDVHEKVNHYLIPILENFDYLVGKTQTNSWLEDEIIEIKSLALMRGLNRRDCIAILDEAQNATYSQLVMFLTRLAEGSRAILIGDPKQSDLTGNDFSIIFDKLYGLEGISCVELGRADIVRSEIIGKILDRLEK